MRQKVSLCGNSLILYHTFVTFKNHEKDLKTLWEKEEMLLTSNFPFLTMFSTPITDRTEVIFLATCNMSSANALNLP